MQAQEITLASRPEGMPTQANFGLKQVELPALKPEIGRAHV